MSLVDYKPRDQDRTAINHLLRLLPLIKKSNRRKAPITIKQVLKLPHEEIAFILARFFDIWVNPATKKTYYGEYIFEKACAIARYIFSYDHLDHATRLNEYTKLCNED